MADAAHHLSEGVGEGERDGQQEVDRQPVGEAGRVLERGGGVGVEEPTPVVTQLLDRLHEADGPPGDDLGDAVQGIVDGHGAEQRLHGTLADEDDPEDERDGPHDVEQAAGHVHPEVPDGRGTASGETADHADSYRDADDRAQHLLQGQRADLREVRHRRLSAVVLPVGVGQERGGGVEAERLGHGAQVLRVQRKRALDADEQVGDAHGHRGEDDEGGGVALPVLLLLGTGPEHAVDGPLGPFQEVNPPIEDGGHVGAQVAPREAQGDDQGDDGPGEPHVRTSRA